jgi:hypothetical protein
MTHDTANSRRWSRHGDTWRQNVSPNTAVPPYQQICKAFETARENYAAYRSECALFAGIFSRGFAEYLGGVRDAVSYEPLKGVREGDGPVDVQEAMHLDEDTYWHFGVMMRVAGGKADDVVRFQVRFKKIEKRWVISLFGHEDFELSEPNGATLQPVYELLVASIKRHYEDGLRLFLDKRGQNLHLPFSAARQAEISGGA